MRSPSPMWQGLRLYRFSCCCLVFGKTYLGDSKPRVIVLDASAGSVAADQTTDPKADAAWLEDALTACRRLKRDAFTGIIPVLMLVPDGSFAAAFEVRARREPEKSAGADLEALEGGGWAVVR